MEPASSLSKSGSNCLLRMIILTWIIHHCTVPVLLPSLQQEALRPSHDAPTAGSQGVDKTLEMLHSIAYWDTMANNVEQYCRSCPICQRSKPSMPPQAPTNHPSWLTLENGCNTGSSFYQQ